MHHARAIVFEAPQCPSRQTLAPKAFEAGDVDVEVGFSGIGSGTERLLWGGAMRRPGLHARGAGCAAPAWRGRHDAIRLFAAAVAY